MRGEHRNPTWTLMLLFLAGVSCNTWKVEYREQHICAAKGSSVVILCSFHHPDNLRVTRVMWAHVKPRHLKGRVIFDSNFRTVAAGFQYIGDRHHSCSLKIHQVTQNDAGNYVIAFNSNKIDAGRVHVGPRLKVVDAKVLVTKTDGNETTKEGDSVNLTCIHRCDGREPPPAFAWFKDGRPINEGRVLAMSNVSPANSGNYTCAVKTQAGTASGAMNINVEYGPKNTSVSVGPATEVHAEQNLTLVCSSRSNPPVENYTWFKISDKVTEVGHKQVFLPRDRGGRYLCSATNKHGTQNSSAVTLKITPRWATFTRDVLLTAAAVTVSLLMIITTVNGVRRLRKKSPWADGGKETQNSDYVNWFIFHENHLEVKGQGDGGTTEPIYVTLNFSNTRNSKMGQQTVSNEEVIYSTVFQ